MYLRTVGQAPLCNSAMITQFEPAWRCSHTQGCKTQITWVDQQCNAPVPDPVTASENQERNIKRWLQFPRAQPGRLLFPEALERGIPEPPCPVLPMLAHSPRLPQTPPPPLQFPPSSHLCPPFRTAAEMGLRPAAPLFSSLPAYLRATHVWSSLCNPTVGRTEAKDAASEKLSREAPLQNSELSNCCRFHLCSGGLYCVAVHKPGPPRLRRSRVRKQSGPGRGRRRRRCGNGAQRWTQSMRDAAGGPFGRLRARSCRAPAPLRHLVSLPTHPGHFRFPSGLL